MVSVNNTKWMKESADSHMEELCKCTSVAAFKPFSECTIKQNACATLQQRVDTGNVRICWTASRKHMSIMHVVSPLLPPPLTPDTWHPLRNLLHQLSRCDLYCHNDLGNSFVNSFLNTHSVCLYLAWLDVKYILLATSTQTLLFETMVHNYTPSSAFIPSELTAPLLLPLIL